VVDLWGFPAIALVAIAGFVLARGSTGARLAGDLRTLGAAERRALSLILPVSMPLVVFGVLASTYLASLSAAMFIPGVLALGIAAILAPSAIVTVLRSAKVELALSIGAIACAAFQVLSPVQAAAIAAGGMIAVERFLHRDVPRREPLAALLADAASFSGAIVVLAGASLAFAGWIMDADIPVPMSDMMRIYIHTHAAFLWFVAGGMALMALAFDSCVPIIVLTPMFSMLGPIFGADRVAIGTVAVATLAGVAALRSEKRWVAVVLLALVPALIYLPGLTIGFSEWLGL
jgi:TRAP-type C4-dicarboxylate transport system permease large subunit